MNKLLLLYHLTHFIMECKDPNIPIMGTNIHFYDAYENLYAEYCDEQHIETQPDIEKHVTELYNTTFSRSGL